MTASKLAAGDASTLVSGSGSMADNASAELQAKGPPLKDTDGEYPGFLWHVWAATGRKRLHNVHVVDSVVIINGRIRAWIFYSHKEKRVRILRLLFAKAGLTSRLTLDSNTDSVEENPEHHSPRHLGLILPWP